MAEQEAMTTSRSLDYCLMARSMPFGVNGEVHTDLGYSSAYANAVQPDGTSSPLEPGLIGSTTGAAVVRYRADGSLDTSFGSGGVAVADFGNGSGSVPATSVSARWEHRGRRRCGER
ncbi:MAG: delta-60 repeat domain-containing protein [Actinomycetota bacterium]